MISYKRKFKKAGKTSEFFKILNKRVISYPRNPLYPDLGLHTLIADKTGDALILEEGNDANVVTPIHDDFIIMTNFPNGDFKHANYDKVYGIGADRYICAHENEIYISFKKDRIKQWKISINEKTIQSLDGLLSNNKIQFTNDEILVKDLICLYK